MSTKNISCGRILLQRIGYGTDAGSLQQKKEQLLTAGFHAMGWPEYEAGEIVLTRQGKPYSARDPLCCFNFSDASSVQAAAFAASPVGIDAEGPRRLPETLLRRLPQAERMLLEGAPDETKRLRIFLRLWTAREAVGKLRGSGLTVQILESDFSGVLQDLPCRVFSEGEHTAVFETEMVRIGTDWTQLLQFCCGETVICAAASEKTAFHIAFLPRVG